MALIEITDDGIYRIKRIKGDTHIRHHLENLGFIPGEPIKVVSRVADGLIVSVKGCRVAVNNDAAGMVVI
ncbi:MAG: ferrous iron transport protein A [Coriobacteriales bacterium]|jgi:ferrous iron transport protein A|nr:ferrous iron transport protein A [Coriobacteriales bacterium]